jgi:hypothetical protein
MNDISKTQVQTRLNKAIESEGLKINDAAACLGINATYVSMIRNEKQWTKCPFAAWEEVLKWVNSGQRLKEYSEKHGKILPYKAEEIKREEKPQELTSIQNKKQIENSKVIIDIEINLIINGKKIRL